jgi:hypothetical protein
LFDPFSLGEEVLDDALGEIDRMTHSAIDFGDWLLRSWLSHLTAGEWAPSGATAPSAVAGTAHPAL